MSGRPRLPKADIVDLRARGWTLERIAAKHAVTRAAVSLCLSRVTRRTNHMRADRACRCGCGDEVRAPRIYATRDCYYRHVTRAGRTDGWRQGMRLARAVVTRYFDIQPEHVVHHEDRDQHNNEPTNLWIFASQGDHLRYHRMNDAVPLWRGDRDPCVLGVERLTIAGR